MESLQEKHETNSLKERLLELDPSELQTMYYSALSKIEDLKVFIETVESLQ